VTVLAEQHTFESIFLFLVSSSSISKYSSVLVMEMVPWTHAPGDISWHAVDRATGPAQSQCTDTSQQVSVITAV